MSAAILTTIDSVSYTGGTGDEGRTLTSPTNTFEYGIPPTKTLLGVVFHIDNHIVINLIYKTNVIILLAVHEAGSELDTFIVYVTQLSPLITVSWSSTYFLVAGLQLYNGVYAVE